jgi:hypothetical protein
LGVVLLDDIQEFMFSTPRYFLEITTVATFMHVAQAYFYRKDNMQKVWISFRPVVLGTYTVAKDVVLNMWDLSNQRLLTVSEN